jgi:hypothetical protein
MFDCKQTLTERLADIVDLLIDFATLGEYGLEEPVGRTNRACEADRGGRAQETFQEALFPNHPRSAPECGAEARRPRGKHDVSGERRRVAALRKPIDRGVRRRLSGAAARAPFRRGPH